MIYFEYGEKETDWLKSRDSVLGAAIDVIGPIERAVNPDLFAALINSIVGQQISTKAQATVWGRIVERFSPVSPDTILGADAETLQSCGLSHRKVGYIRDIAQAVQSGQIDLDGLYNHPDEGICKTLCALNGIGKWTAEMLMIFSMQRPNILSYGDLGIQRGMRMLYRHRKITPPLFEKHRKRYAPYATVAGLYLWAIAGGAMEGLTDPK